MRKLLCFALAATSLACSGGRDPSRTISGDGEYAGPGAPGSFDDSDSEGFPTTSTSTLFALCIKACTHIHAKDCDGAPAHAAEACWAECSTDINPLHPSCSDESAAVYACTIDAKITCSGGFVGTPTVNGCDDEASELQKCVAPGSDCVVSPGSAEFCLAMGLSTFLVCSDGVNAPSDCISLTDSGTAFCCP